MATVLGTSINDKKVRYGKWMFKVIHEQILYANCWSIATNQMITKKYIYSLPLFMELIYNQLKQSFTCNKHPPFHTLSL